MLPETKAEPAFEKCPKAGEVYAGQKFKSHLWQSHQWDQDL